MGITKIPTPSPSLSPVRIIIIIIIITFIIVIITSIFTITISITTGALPSLSQTSPSLQCILNFIAQSCPYHHHHHHHYFTITFSPLLPIFSILHTPASPSVSPRDSRLYQISHQYHQE